MCACTHCLRGKKNPTAQIWQFNSKVLVDVLTACSWCSILTCWSHSRFHLCCCVFSWLFCPSWAWCIDRSPMGEGDVLAALPWPHKKTAGPEESGYAGFCRSSKYLQILQRSNNFWQRARKGTCRVAASPMNPQSLGTDTIAFWGMFKSWLLRRNFLQYNAWSALSLLESAFLLSQQCSAL